MVSQFLSYMHKINHVQIQMETKHGHWSSLPPHWKAKSSILHNMALGFYLTLYL